MSNVFSNYASKPVGHTQGSKLVKNIRGSKHMLRKPQYSIAINRDVLEGLSPDIAYIHIHDKEDNQDYFATVNWFLSNGFTVNRGFGSQVALPLYQWTGDSDSMYG